MTSVKIDVLAHLVYRYLMHFSLNVIYILASEQYA